MFLRGTRLLVAATEDLFQFLLAYIRFRNRRPDSLRRECCISDEDRTRNPSELIHPSSSKILQSESSRPTGQTSGGGKMFKNRQNSAMERPMFSLLCKQVLDPNKVIAMVPNFKCSCKSFDDKNGRLPVQNVKSEVSSSDWSRRVRGAKRCNVALRRFRCLRRGTMMLASKGETRIRF